MGNGYWQKALRVNLTTGDIRIETIEEKDLKAFIGGAGLAAEILRREIPQKIDPLSPENLVIFGTGPFQGPSVPGGAKFSIMGISPLTGTYADTAAGANWGPSIKDAGYDLLILEGKSEKPVYLHIVDDDVQIEERAADGTGQVRDVPAPQLARPGRDLQRRPRTLRRCLGAPPVLHQVPLAQHSVDRRLGRDVLAPVSKDGHDLLGALVPKLDATGDLEDVRALLGTQLVARR